MTNCVLDAGQVNCSAGLDASRRDGCGNQLDAKDILGLGASQGLHGDVPVYTALTSAGSAWASELTSQMYGHVESHGEWE